MPDIGSVISGIAVRYATAVFELAKEAKELPDVEDDMDALAEALDGSSDFADLIANPVYTRAETAAAIGAIASKMGLNDITANTLGLMARKRRLLVLPQLINTIKARIAEEKGEVTAEVTAAKVLTEPQQKALARALQDSVGKNVKINVAVDESLIGGLVVKLGSKMIDSSVRSRLSSLSNAMKGVG
ncbi:MAG: F0F1 ATP synthase subunit delta [Rhodobacteraceae bacterium]|nr:F0F1 ATP synthase subunit delta [Paracoccaceae bacterium]